MGKHEIKKTAIIALSGGLDSCVTAAMANLEYRLAAIHFRYGQRTEERELQAFHDISDYYGIKERLVIKMDHLAVIGGSSLTDLSEDIPVTGIESGVPSTYVPFRNANILSAAVSWAEVIGAFRVFIGINQVDSSGYPDCSKSFLDVFNRAVDAGTRPETNISITAPLLDLTKTDIVRRGIELEAPLEKSWSCYQGLEEACGICDSCRLRLAGFAGAGVKDPLTYSDGI